MFRTIRKKKNEISIENAKALLKNERRGVLAVNGDDNYPYAIPINFYYDEADQKIYFHGAHAGHKVDALKKCDKVCFTVWGNERVKEDTWAPYVQSVVVFGHCNPIQDPSVVAAKLKQFAMKYYPDEDTADKEIAAFGKAVRMYEITIAHLSGKEVQER